MVLPQNGEGVRYLQGSRTCAERHVYLNELLEWEKKTAEEGHRCEQHRGRGARPPPSQDYREEPLLS